MSIERPEDLETWAKGDLVARAEALGVEGAAKYTKLELIDEIRRAEGVGDRGFLGKARDLLRGVVEKGLSRALGNEASKGAPSIGRDTAADERVVDAGKAETSAASEPLASHTLAEIHLAQGDRRRARAVLEALLRDEPDDARARQLLAAIDARAAEAPSSSEVVAPPLEEGVAATPADVDLDAIRATLARAEDPTPAPAPPEPPVPARYDVDECVAMPVDAHTLYVYWETRASTVSKARRALGEGAQAVLRVLVVEPTERGPQVSTRDLPIEGESLASGETFVRELPSGAILRAALGFALGERFLPIAHTADVESPAEAPSPAAAHEVRAWSPPATRGEPAPPPPRVEHAELPREVAASRPDFSGPAELGEPQPHEFAELPPELLGRGLSSAELAEQRRRIAMGAGAAPSQLGRERAANERAAGVSSEQWGAQPGSSAWGNPPR